MNENQPTTRYLFKTSNLMDSYYAVNSIDGRKKKVNYQKENLFWEEVKNLWINATSFLMKVFEINLTRFNFLAKRNKNLLPSILNNTYGLKVNPSLIPVSQVNSHQRKNYTIRFHNTTNK